MAAGPRLVCPDRLRSDSGPARGGGVEVLPARLAEHLFVSPHTVSGHLRHIFMKLGVNSRVDLARIVASYER